MESTVLHAILNAIHTLCQNRSLKKKGFLNFLKRKTIYSELFGVSQLCALIAPDVHLLAVGSRRQS